MIINRSKISRLCSIQSEHQRNNLYCRLLPIIKFSYSLQSQIMQIRKRFILEIHVICLGLCYYSANYLFFYVIYILMLHLHWLFIIVCRVSLGVTTLLTMSTQQASINNSLPPVAYTKVRFNVQYLTYFIIYTNDLILLFWIVGRRRSCVFL